MMRKAMQGGRVPPVFNPLRPLSTFVMTALLMLCAAVAVPSNALASIIVSPARIEVDIGPWGATRHITIVNRGPFEISLDLYAGYGSQALTGAPVYFDDEQSIQQASEWIDIVPGVVELSPGEHAQVAVRFKPSADKVAAYPVVFAQERDDSSSPSRDSIKSRLRIALPVLATFSETNAQRYSAPMIRSLAARALSGGERLAVEVDIENIGTVHGPADVRVEAYDTNGNLIRGMDLQAGRLLPGAPRRLTSEWDRAELPNAVRFVGTVQQNGGESSMFMALSLPEKSNGTQEFISTSLTATPVASGRSILIEGQWQVGQGSDRDIDAVLSKVTAFVFVYDENGQPLDRTLLSGKPVVDGPGRFRIEEVVNISPQRVADIGGVGLELWVDGVSTGYAAAAFDNDGRIEATVSRIHP